MTQNYLLKNLSLFFRQATYISRIHRCGVFWGALYDTPLAYLSTSVLITEIYCKKWHLVEPIFSLFTSLYMSSPLLALCCYMCIVEPIFQVLLKTKENKTPHWDLSLELYSSSKLPFGGPLILSPQFLLCASVQSTSSALWLLIFLSIFPTRFWAS